MIRMVSDKLLLEKTAEKDVTTPGGIFLPSAADKERVSKAKVVSAGYEAKYVNPGATVFFDRATALEFTSEGVVYYVVKEKELIGILEG
jgi:co-chaperonin GroES (HSP10)